MRFFKSTGGSYYPVSNIVRIGKERDVETRLGKAKVCDVELDSGKKLEIWSHELDDIVRDNGSVIPAAPGTYLLHDLIDADDEPSKVPVLAWRVGTAAADIEPITADGVNDGTTAWLAILMPDGTITRQADRSWPSLDIWKIDQLEAIAERIRARDDRQGGVEDGQIA